MKKNQSSSKYTIQIKSVEEIYDLASEAKSVYVAQIWNRTQPASWMISMQARTLVRWIRMGYIFKRNEA
jgi:hypothetical protein